MRLYYIVYPLAALCLLCGCGGTPWDNYQPVASLLPVETLGFDYADGAWVLTAAAEETVLTGRGDTIPEAAAALKEQAGGKALFFPHTRYALLSDRAVMDLEAIFAWFTHNGRARLNLPVYLASGDTPEALMAADGQESVTAVLDAIHRKSPKTPTLPELVRQGRRTGAAVCPAVTGGEIALVPGGSGVLRRDGAVVFLTETESLGAALLLQERDLVPVYLPEGEVQVSPRLLSRRWEGGSVLLTLDYTARIPQGVSPAAEAAVDAYLTAAMAAALARAWDLEADFLHLTEDGTLPADSSWQIQCRGRLLPPAGQEAQP